MAGPYSVLAMSLGGMVATAWAQRYPAEVERLVLINTSMRPFSRAQQRLRRAAWPDLLRIARHWKSWARECSRPPGVPASSRAASSWVITSEGGVPAWAASAWTSAEFFAGGTSAPG